MKKNLRRLMLVVIAVVLGLNIYRWNAQGLLKNELPMPFAYGSAIVLSGSMEPRLHIDDLVIVRQTDHVAVGDIIIYQNGSSLVIHRVIAVDGDEIVTQGDANTTPDDPITIEAVKGVMVLSIPGAGVPVRILRHPVAVLLLLAFSIVLMERSFRKDRRKRKQELNELEEEIQRLKSEMGNGSN